MEGGIDAAVFDRMAAQALQPTRQHPGQGHAPGGNAQQQERAAIAGALQHLGGEPIKGASQFWFREQFEPHLAVGLRILAWGL